MRRVYYSVFLALALLLAGSLSAKHSDDYVIGTYSYIKSSFPFFYQNRELLCQYLNEMGYNSNIIETDIRDNDIAGLLELLDRYKIDAWVSDRGFSKDPENMFRYSISPLTTSSYLRFEAEYADESDVNKGDSKQSRYWYSARSDSYFTRVGKIAKNKDASNGNTWIASRDTDKAGCLFTDLRYRWPNRNGYYVRVGYELHSYQKNPPNYEGDYVWLKYRFKLSNPKPDLKPEDPLLSFQLAGFTLLLGNFDRVATPVDLIAGGKKQEEVFLTYGDLNKLSKKDDYIDYELRVAYKDLIDANLLTADLDDNPATTPSPSVMKISNLNPRVFWHANCDVELDYVEVRDQISYELQYEKDTCEAGVMKRAKMIKDQSPGNLSGFYSFDEPFQGQFDSFNKVQDMLLKENLSMFSATYDYQHTNITIDAQNKQYYSHMEAFQEEAKPKIFAPDIYPITPKMKFNPSKDAQQDERFIQKVIDDKLLKVYQMGKTYTMQDTTRKFYPIVQVFGRWAKGIENEKDYWALWILPPYATQKALLYLPLCYGADGIFHYRFQAFQTKDGYGDYVGLAAAQQGNSYAAPVATQPTMDAIIDTNPKVFTYGKLIKKMRWLGSDTIMSKVSKAIAAPRQSMIKEAYVQEDTGALYDGYIQTGYYLDDSDNPYLMLVNRRGNYFVPGKQLEEVNVHSSQYDTYFPQAASQTIVFELDKQTVDRYGSFPGFYDPADSVLYHSSNGIINLEIEAGEGKLLQMMGTLPETFKGKAMLPGKTVLSGKIELQKGSKLILSENSNLVLLPGTQLIIPDKSSIVLDGKIELMGDAMLIVNGKWKTKSPEITSAENAQFITNTPPHRGFFKRLFGCK
ncbi:MAG: hypothetical protein CVU50_07710 [Candidatus Cloacimonetes bacterium HGW-Cloacimonetes-3]|jgi:hypothetical protein|nr:MAG: hypothetical protein CVU50_07710 [Candidatus Cloacimonetes bacterium HGW-Cloacimonetes-3]